ncbi:MAG: DUF1684 domain-containing protein [Planctomycetes bacterium]|nr:DUF1684 domain-containing protein [Planctomycetota bacterium]
MSALLMTATCSRPSPEASYASELQAARAAKDDAFKTSTDSPIPPGRRAALLPLAYFAPDQDYIASASLAPAGPDERPTVEMPTSTGKMRTMQRVGRLEFVLKGQSLTLGAFIEAGSPDTDRLFVPFTDLTSGTETYPAGRYLDLLRTPTGIYIIDFNRAYYPYCYYNPAYDCPYPPPENRLTIPIRAGERMATLK